MLETYNRVAGDTSKTVDRTESCNFFIENVTLVGSSEQVSIFESSQGKFTNWQQLQPNIVNTAETFK